MVDVSFDVIEEFSVNVDLFFSDKQFLESFFFRVHANIEHWTRQHSTFALILYLHETIYLKDNFEQTIVEEDEKKNDESAHLVWKMLSEGGMEVKCESFLISRSTHDLIEVLTNPVQSAGLVSATERSSARLLVTKSVRKFESYTSP